MRRCIVGLVGAAIAIGCASPGAVIVDLRTDVVPRFEAASARIELLDAEESVVLRTIDHPLDAAYDYVAGARVAELLAVDAGSYTLRATLRMADGEIVVGRRIRIDVRGALAVTVVLTRDCVGVTCPAADGAARSTECMGAVCVDPGCSPETPELCPAPTCTSDAECAAGAACATGRCADGVCLYESASSSCAPTEWCDPDAGCVPDERCLVMGGCDAVAELSGGWEHSCARYADGRVACWGDDGLGAAHPSPTFVDGIPGSVSLAAGWAQTCSLSADGGVTCFGQTIAAGSTTHVALPDAAVDLATGSLVACALLSDGRAYCWGNGDEGELGSGRVGFAPDPELVVGTDASPLTAIAMGIRHVCGIERGGTVVCWGDDAMGQLGDGNTSTVASAPVRVVGLTDAVELSLGQVHSCARLADGRVRCWGLGSSGQLGLGESMPGFARPTPTDPVIGVDDAIQLVSGQNFTCALHASTEVSCWGSTWRSDGVAWVPEPAPGYEDVVELARAGVGFCARQADGRVYCQGGNFKGELGDGTNVARYTPGPVLAAR
ncbi:MAG: RCC1 domain-containing protein [Sandaracinaceae bacterium]